MKKNQKMNNILNNNFPSYHRLEYYHRIIIKKNNPYVLPYCRSDEF